jgi:hypothetical protein
MHVFQIEAKKKEEAKISTPREAETLPYGGLKCPWIQ